MIIEKAAGMLGYSVERSTVQRVAISRDSRGRKWPKVKFSSRDQRERFWLGRGFARRSNLEEDLRKSMRGEEGGGRRACGIKKGWGRRSYEAVHRRHGRLRERAMRFWCSTVWMHRAGPAEKTSACWRQYYPSWSKQAAENRSGKIAYFLTPCYITAIFP